MTTQPMARPLGGGWGPALALLLALTLLGGWLPAATPAAAALGAPGADNTGTDFWLAFPRLFDPGNENALFVLAVTITGAPGTTGTVAATGIAFSQGYTLDGNGSAIVIVPNAALITSNGGQPEAKGVRVTASAPVTVHGQGDMQSTADGYLALPTAALGTSYRAMTYATNAGGPGLRYGTDITIVGTAAATAVTITPTSGAPDHAAGVPFTVTVNVGETYRIATITGADLTGTTIVADKPIVVLSGNDLRQVPTGVPAGERLVEQLPPVDTWRDDFLLVPFLGRTGGYFAHILANTDGTEIRVDGTLVATLNAGQVTERDLSAAARITTSRPALVAQYAKGQNSGGTGDPTMILAAAPAQWRAAYTFRPPVDTFDPNTSGASQFLTHTVTLITRATDVGQITLDGTAIPAIGFIAIGTSGYSFARIPVVAGRGHTLAGPRPFGATLYGFGNYVAYSYPLGLALRTVTALAVAPASGTYGGTTALSATLTDSATGDPLAGKTVTFDLNGATVCGTGPYPTCPLTDASGVATLPNVSLAGIGAGTYPGGVGASFAGDGTTLVSGGVGTLTVNPAAQAITFNPNPLPDRTLSDAPFTVSATASSGLPVSFAAAPASVCTASGTNGATITLVGAGTCTVTASQPGDANYAAATPVARPFAVSPAPVGVTVTATGPGTVSPGTGTYQPGPLTLTATPQPGALFTGWRVDGVVVGWGPTLTLNVTNARTINARFAARPAFSDVPTSNVAWEAITQLAARGIINGYGDGTYGPTDNVQRAQIAALIVRALGWDGTPPGGPAPFSDLGLVDPELARAIVILTQRGIAQGYPDGTFNPTGEVTHAQAISLIARSMVQAGYWQAVTAAADDGTVSPNIPANSPHRLDLLTFVKYAGAIPDRPAGQAWQDWEGPSSRGWTAQVLWAALDSHFTTNRAP